MHDKGGMSDTATQIIPELVAIEQRAKAMDVNLSAALKEAGVAPSTWYRWSKTHNGPRLSTIRKIHQALDQLSGAAA